MKGTRAFTDTIKAYIDMQMGIDNLFRETVESQKDKTIEGCCNYILQEVQKSGVNGWTDDEVYALAKHFYDEREIKNGKEIKCHVVVNHEVELTEEEKREARQRAIDKYESEQRRKIEEQSKKKTVDLSKSRYKQLSLFGDE